MLHHINLFKKQIKKTFKQTETSWDFSKKDQNHLTVALQ